LFVEQFRAILPVGLGFAAGAMIWMVWRELLPETARQMPRRTVVGYTGCSFLAMFAFQSYLLA
jgi:zinc transporter ZupT